MQYLKLQSKRLFGLGTALEKQEMQKHQEEKKRKAPFIKKPKMVMVMKLTVNKIVELSYGP